MSPSDAISAAPAVVFWELTRLCPLRCAYCRVVEASPSEIELDDDEAMLAADALVRLGAKTVVLTGGEPTARKGFEAIALRLARGGVRVRLFTSGFGFGEEEIEKALAAGIRDFAVSLDGPREIHDALRPKRGEGGPSSFDAASETLRRLVLRGVAVRAVTAVSRANAGSLFALYEIVRGLGVPRWQVHQLQNHGRARELPAELICDLAAIEEIVRVSLLAAKERIVLCPLHCTVGYMTEEEPVLRNRESTGAPVWQGCRAGISSLAITADGKVKGCAALPDEFATASLRDASLAEIWKNDSLFPYSRLWSRRVLASACAACAFGDTCRAGCPAVAYGATGSIGLNPSCLKLARGRRP